MLSQSLLLKLETLVRRYEEIEQLMATPEVMQDTKQFRALGQEYAQLGPTVVAFVEYKACVVSMDDAQAMLTDADMRDLAEEEIRTLKARIKAISEQLQVLLLPVDPNDQRNVFLEIRAGTGGDEAALFSGDLFRMYSRFAEAKRWQVEVMSKSEGDHGGYKEIIVRMIGQGAFSELKFESGAHRVQRVPTTESQGRIHTSACTVAVMPEADEIHDVVINPADLRVDTFRASGAGGQHVNKTDSAIRLTHLPTGLVVECQEERSQHKNRAKAMSLLGARILQQEQDAQAAEQAATRKSLVGSGDRSERIRTYNFPQGRVTDHRINLTLYALDEVMEGQLGMIINPLRTEFQAQQLVSMDQP